MNVSKKFPDNPICVKLGDRHRDAVPSPIWIGIKMETDPDRHQNRNSDPDRDQNDAET